MTTHNLPQQPTPFIGRSSELTEIAALLSDPACRLLTLLGPGGIGKTRLALQAAAEQLPHFAHGVFFVSLAPVNSPDLIASAVANALQISFYNTEDTRVQIVRYLREKRILLLMDNFEHLMDGVGLLPDILQAAPNVKLLVTSRERLNVQEEWVLTLDGLRVPNDQATEPLGNYSAVQLFVQRARQVQAKFSLDDNAEAVKTICQRVEGMPLGLELAASWLRAMPCRQIAAQMSSSIDFLTTPLRNMPERHRNLRAVFEQSWNLLSATEQHVLTHLSVFRGGFDLEAAEQVAGATLPTLAALVDKSLIRLNPNGRYDLHELLRQYTEELLRASGEVEVARDSHSAYYAAFLQHKWQPLRSQQQVQTLDEIEVEFENIRSAWQTMVEKHKSAELSMSGYSLWYFSDLRGRYHEALALFEQAEDALSVCAGDAQVDRVIGQMLTRRGFLYVSLGKPGEGRALAEQGLAILQRVGSPEDVILALDSLCLTSLWLRDFPAQKQNAEQAVQVAANSDDRWLLARAQYWLADAIMYLAITAVHPPDLEEARQLGEEALALAEACGDLWLIGLASGEVLGGLALHSGNYAEVRQRREKSLKLFETLGQVVVIAQTHWGIGVALMGMKDYSGAASHYLRSLKILAEHGSYAAHQIRAVLFIADTWRAQGNQIGAVELLTLGLHHPESLAFSRAEAEQKLRQLQVEVAPDLFAAVQERGKALNLTAVIAELIAQYDQSVQSAAPPISSTDSLSIAPPLTARELEILRLISQGLTNAEIAHKLSLAVGTVKVHTSNIYGKLGVSSRTQAAAEAQKLALL